jgi:hypothetical protein
LHARPNHRRHGGHRLRDELHSVQARYALRDVEKITTRTVIGAILVVAGTIAISLAEN